MLACHGKELKMKVASNGLALMKIILGAPFFTIDFGGNQPKGGSLLFHV
jgi:hypothetical protein